MKDLVFLQSIHFVQTTYFCQLPQFASQAVSNEAKLSIISVTMQLNALSLSLSLSLSLHLSLFLFNVTWKKLLMTVVLNLEQLDRAGWSSSN